MIAGAGGASSVVSPCLLVESIEDELRFLKAVFGAQLNKPAGRRESTVWQVEAQLGNTILKIGRTHPEHAQVGSMLYVWVDDVAATFARAVQAGASPISQPRDQTWGVREAGFRDPQGSIWWVGRRLRKPSSREVEQLLTQQRRKRL